MSCLTLYNDSTNDATVVSNRFIDEFMKDANDAQLKVYFYLIRMLNANLATSITDMADKFNHTETDVIRSLKYWERMKLLHLDYDEHNNIIGIHIQDLDKMPKAEIVPLASRKSSAPLSRQAKSAPKSEINAAEAVRTAVAKSTTAKSASAKDVKRTYSLDEIKAFKKDDDFARILFISEQYLRRPLTASDMQTFAFLYDQLHFSVDLIDYLVEYCVSRHKESHFYIQSVALGWAEDNIKTVDQAKAHASLYDRSVYTILKALGNSNMPTPEEAKLIEKWQNTYAFSMEIILEACRRCVLTTNNNRMNYVDGTLTNWYNSGVHKLSDISPLDLAHKEQDSPRAESKPPRKSGKNTFNQFEQRSYDFDALEKELLSN